MMPTFQLAHRDLIAGLVGIRNIFAHEVAEIRPSQAIRWLGVASAMLAAIDNRR